MEKMHKSNGGEGGLSFSLVAESFSTLRGRRHYDGRATFRSCKGKKTGLRVMADFGRFISGMHRLERYGKSRNLEVRAEVVKEIVQ